jgi:hypothetical protein
LRGTLSKNFQKQRQICGVKARAKAVSFDPGGLIAAYCELIFQADC